MLRAWTYRLYPTQEQAVRLEQTFETHRHLWNAALAERRDAWREEHRSVTYPQQQRALTAQRRTNPWLAAENTSAEQRTLRRLDRAFAAFFRRLKKGEKPGYPQFKPRGAPVSVEYTYNNGVKVLDPRHLRLQPVGIVRMRGGDCLPEGTIKTVTVKREADGFFAVFTIQCPDVVPTPIPIERPEVGLDLGLTSFLTTSEGEHIAPPQFYRRAQRRLRRVQRRTARRQRGSHRWRKASRLEALVHLTIRRERADWHHCLSKELAETYGTLYVEDLNITGIARTRLAKSTLDAGWAAFVQMLTYKAERAGGRVVTVDARNTTQACSACGGLPDEPLGLSDRVYRCAHCGYVGDRDENAARNILARGQLAEEPRGAEVNDDPCPV